MGLVFRQVLQGYRLDYRSQLISSEKIVVLQLTACLRRFAKLPKGNFENTRNVMRKPFYWRIS